VQRHLKHLFQIAVVAVLLSAGTTLAAITSTTGAAAVATPPADVSSNNWESNTQIRLFAEQQNLTLSASLPLDISVPGTSPGSTDSNLSLSTVPAGSTVTSYALHFDVSGTRATNNPLEAIGSITFDQQILGLIVSSTTLNNTNATVGLTGTTYSSGPDHGLELNPVGGGTSDVITLSPDRHTVTVDLMNASFADDARIIVAVPEPGAAFLSLPALALLLRRRR
jgi:hypothetical protein